MEFGKCTVVYVDRRIVSSGSTYTTKEVIAKAGKDKPQIALYQQEDEHIRTNVEAILNTFEEVYVCDNGVSCLQKITQLTDPANPAATILLIDVPFADDNQSSGEDKSSQSRALTSNPVEKDEPQDIYGMHLLRHVCSCIQQRTLSPLIVPVAIVGSTAEVNEALQSEPSLHALSQCATSDSGRLVRYLDVGAQDVLSHPLVGDRMRSLAVHAYRVCKDVASEDASSLLTKRNRKLSWIGIDEQRPFAYLREAMVSGLMHGICNPESINDSLEASDLKIEPEREELVKTAVGLWNFSAHDFTSDELVLAARTILLHALQMPELAPWRLPIDDLTVFIMASRRAYNDFVLYHNFRHVVDVLQAIFFFLLQVGLLPPYQVAGNPEATPDNAVAAVLKPFDALTLLISALGHDVGHPGVNNAFLVTLNAPLAQLYNDRSVLEAFHCAAYSQILRRYWPSAFASPTLRKLMINCILATDMSLHFKFINEMRSLQESIAAAQATADGWVPKVTDENRDLVCGLLIKCADISNVARKYACAAQWARVLTDEFSNQGAMEKELNMPTCLFGGAPDPTDALKLAESQLGFMNIFARPLFEGVSVILPKMNFTLAELSVNKVIWKERIEAENSRKMSFVRGPLSPISRSTATPSEVDSIDGRDRSFSQSGDNDSVTAPKGSLLGKDNGAQRSGSLVAPHNETSSLAPLNENDARSNSITSNESRGRSVSNTIGLMSASRLGNTLPKPAGGAGGHRRHSSVYSNTEGGGPPSSRHVSRPNTADRDRERSLSRAMPREYQDAIKEIAAHSRSPSPTKRSASPSKTVQIQAPAQAQTGDVSMILPSANSQTTSNATTVDARNGRTSPSTKASSVEEDAKVPVAVEIPPPHGANLTLPRNKSEEFTFLRHDPNTFMPGGRKFQAMSVYGPDVLAMAAANSPGKHATGPHMPATVESDETAKEDRHDLRSVQSAGRLKGFRWFKKKIKAEGVEVDQMP